MKRPGRLGSALSVVWLMAATAASTRRRNLHTGHEIGRKLCPLDQFHIQNGGRRGLDLAAFLAPCFQKRTIINEHDVYLVNETD